MELKITVTDNAGHTTELVLPDSKRQLVVSDGTTSWQLTPAFTFEAVKGKTSAAHLVISAEGKIEWQESQS